MWLVYSANEIMKKNEKCIRYDRMAYIVSKQTSGHNIKIEDFFYDTFYVPDNLDPLPREIVKLPFYQKYICDLGCKEGDYCFVAQDSITGETVGAVWTRFIEDDVIVERGSPFLLISVSAEYRGNGIGSTLLLRILTELKEHGYTKVSLTVNKQNRAVDLYEKFGFSIYGSDDENYFMVKYL